jgi:hypothetical protein
MLFYRVIIQIFLVVENEKFFEILGRFLERQGKRSYKNAVVQA